MYVKRFSLGRGVLCTVVWLYMVVHCSTWEGTDMIFTSVVHQRAIPTSLLIYIIYIYILRIADIMWYCILRIYLLLIYFGSDVRFTPIIYVCIHCIRQHHDSVYCWLDCIYIRLLGFLGGNFTLSINAVSGTAVSQGRHFCRAWTSKTDNELKKCTHRQEGNYNTMA